MKSISSKSGFADPVKIKGQHPKDEPSDGKRSPWDFRCPQYDQRSSNFVNAGTHYGVGHAQPVGREGNPLKEVPTLPRHGVKTMVIDDEG